jgi:hypothetical protein
MHFSHRCSCSCSATLESRTAQNVLLSLRKALRHRLAGPSPLPCRQSPPAVLITTRIEPDSSEFSRVLKLSPTQKPPPPHMPVHKQQGKRAQRSTARALSRPPQGTGSTHCGFVAPSCVAGLRAHSRSHRSPSLPTSPPTQSPT